MILRTSQFELTLTADSGLRCHLVHVPSGSVLADGEYSYSFGPPVFSTVRHEDETVLLSGATDTGIAVEQRFAAHPNEGWLEETITLTNRGSTPMDMHSARCGFVLPVSLSDESKVRQQFAAVPYLREPNGSREQYAEYSLEQVLTQQFETGLWVALSHFSPDPTSVTPEYAAEGWSWRYGEQGFLVSKYSQCGMEWSILDRVPLPCGRIGLRWGGFGIYRGHPEHGAWLLPGQAHRFGVTRLTAVGGDRRQAFYAFRAEMAERGHRCPDGFNPPVHWNELYDNELFWLPDAQHDDPAMRKQHYSLADMKEEAAKAVAFGCEALYLDPGWDTNFASKIWDEARLGSFKSFTTMLANEYGLRCSLHTPLSGWCNPSSHSADCYRLDRFGRRAHWDVATTERSMRHLKSPICGASRQYLDETARRLNALARDGAVYLMFDGTLYHAECWDRNHGHPVPARMEEHAQATLQLARMVHEQYPNVLIEMHDPVQPYWSRYTPTYYGHGAAGFDSVWAFELMIHQMEMLLSRKAIVLYYYNLAYSMPLYLHIDLRTDNANALAFWWNASTCRHLGIGGTHADPAAVEAHKSAMKTYMRLKPYFTHGVFYGIDEMTHVHASSDGSSAVINCFNLEDRPVARQIRFEPAELGLSTARTYRFSGPAFERAGKAYVGTVDIAARGHTLIEVS